MMADLSARDRILLKATGWIVPDADRTDWFRHWNAELFYQRHPRSVQSRHLDSLYPGVVLDALWLRVESHRRALSGTALLCMLLMGMSVFFAALPLLAILGSSQAFLKFCAENAPRFLSEGSLVTLVSFATAARLIEHSLPVAPLTRVRANLFQLAKIAFVLLIAFLLSKDVTQPLESSHPFTAEVVQPQLFVLFALVGLRWSFRDSDGRCRYCLRTLATPTRVGRPSRNFLDSNGTELLCDAGHGLLSIPEIETSWRRSSRWIGA